MPRHSGHALPREGKMKLRPVVCQGTQAMLYHENVRGLDEAEACCVPRHPGHALPREGKMKLRPVVCQGT